MSTRREFLQQAAILSSAAAWSGAFPAAIAKALTIDPEPGSTFLDAEPVVVLMQENRSFDHAFGTLKGVRGFNDPRAIALPNGNPVWVQTNRRGESYVSFRLNIKDSNATWLGCLPHGRTDQVDARNGGRYDRWLAVKRLEGEGYADMPFTLGHYTREDIPFLFAANATPAADEDPFEKQLADKIAALRQTHEEHLRYTAENFKSSLRVKPNKPTSTNKQLRLRLSDDRSLQCHKRAAHRHVIATATPGTPS